MKPLCRTFAASQKLHIAITDQTNHKNKLESVAKQRFQVYSWFGFERKAERSHFFFLRTKVRMAKPF